MTLLQDGLIAFLSAVGLTALVWLVAGAVLHTGRPIVPGLLLVLPLRGEALAMEADVRELRRLQSRLPGARMVLVDCGLTEDARGLASTWRTGRSEASWWTRRNFTWGEKERGTWKNWPPMRAPYIASFFKMPKTAIRFCDFWSRGAR